MFNDYKKFGKNYTLDKEIADNLTRKGDSTTLLSQTINSYLKNIKYKNCLLIANHIKSVGKTVTTFNLAWVLSYVYNKKTLIIDMDPEGKISQLFEKIKVNKKIDDQETLIKVLTNYNDLNTKNYSSYIEKITNNSNLDLINAPLTLRDFEFQLMASQEGEKRLYFPVKKLSKVYDYVLIDSNSSTNILSINAYIAADWVLVPMRHNVPYALRALQSLSFFIQNLNTKWSSNIKLLGYHYTMCPTNFNPKEDNSLKNDLYGVNCFNSCIIFSEEINSLLQSLRSDFDQNIARYMQSKIFQDYKEFTKELVEAIESSSITKTN